MPIGGHNVGSALGTLQHLLALRLQDQQQREAADRWAAGQRADAASQQQRLAQSQTFHQDELDHQQALLAQQQQYHQAALAQQLQIRNDALGQHKADQAALQQDRQDRLNQQADLKQQGVDAQIAAKKEADTNRSRNIVASDLEHETNTAAQDARTPDEQEAVQFWRKRAKDVLLGQKTPDSAYETGQLPEEAPRWDRTKKEEYKKGDRVSYGGWVGTVDKVKDNDGKDFTIFERDRRDTSPQGPQPKQLPTLESIRAGALKQKDERQKEQDFQRARKNQVQMEEDEGKAVEQRNKHTEATAKRGEDLKNKALSAAARLPYKLWEPMAKNAGLDAADMLAHPYQQTLSSIRTESEKYPDQREFLDKTIAALENRLPADTNTLYKGEVKALQKAVNVDKGGTAEGLWLDKQQQHLRRAGISGSDETALVGHLKRVLKESRWPDQSEGGTPPNRPSGAPPEMPEPVPAASKAAPTKTVEPAKRAYVLAARAKQYEDDGQSPEQAQKMAEMDLQKAGY